MIKNKYQTLIKHKQEPKKCACLVHVNDVFAVVSDTCLKEYLVRIKIRIRKLFDLICTTTILS